MQSTITRRDALAEQLLDLVKDLKPKERYKLKSYKIDHEFYLQCGQVLELWSSKITTLSQQIKRVLSSPLLNGYAVKVENEWNAVDWSVEVSFYIIRN